MPKPRPIPAPVARPAHVAPLRAGADPAQRGEPGRRWASGGIWDAGDTRLHWAALAGPVAWARALLAGGVDPNEKNRNGASPIWAPVFYGRLDMSLLLLAAGANADPYPPFNDRPYIVAVARRRRGVGGPRAPKTAHS